MGLYSLFLDNTENQIHKLKHYFPIYERYLSDYINKSVVIYEIGVDYGGSLLMWKKYLSPMAKIVGIDINDSCKDRIKDDQCFIRIGNQSDREFLKGIINEFGAPDIVIDDGSHIQKDMISTFKYLFPFLNNNGVYIVEDAHTCYWAKWGGGYKKSDTFIEYAKNMVDDINAFHFDANNGTRINISKQLYSISFFDSVVVFEKKLHGQPQPLKKGKIV